MQAAGLARARLKANKTRWVSAHAVGSSTSVPEEVMDADISQGV